MARPSEIKNLYERLGVSPSASQDEIKSAYRRLAHQWHPDKNPGNEVVSRLEFIAVSEAFKELSEEGRQYFGETNQPGEGLDFYEVYNSCFNAFNKINPELGAALKLWITPEIAKTLRNFNF